MVRRRTWLGVIVGAVFGSLVLTAPAPAVAAPAALAPTSLTTFGAICEDFLIFPSWCRYLQQPNGEDLKQPYVGTPGQGQNASNSIEMGAFVRIIITNIIEILLKLVGAASVVMIIYGGFKYLLANGNASKIQDGTTTITRAMIGLVVGVMGSGIVNTIATISQQAGGDETVLYETLLNRVLTILGIVAVIFALWGAFNIVSSHGNPTRLAKGKQTVIWACIGVAVIILAAVIANAVLTGATEGVVK